jgi:hypothetical protein
MQYKTFFEKKATCNMNFRYKIQLNYCNYCIEIVNGSGYDLQKTYNLKCLWHEISPQMFMIAL